MPADERVPSLPKSRSELVERLQDAGLSGETIRAIAAEARPALVLDTTPAEEAAIPLGATKLGGLPDLPRDTPWPVRPAYGNAEDLAARYTAEAANLYADAGLPPPWMSEADGKTIVEQRKRLNEEAWAGTRKLMAEAGIEVDLDLDNIGKASHEEIEAYAKAQLAMSEAVQKPFPLPFIGQFDLAELSKEHGLDAGLPDRGRLLLFYDLWLLPASFEPRARAGLRLIYDETPVADLMRTELPQEFASTAGLRKTLLKPAAITPRPVVTTIPTGDAAWYALALSNQDDAILYHQWLFTLGWPTAEDGGNHQLGGWPRRIQDGMQRLSQLAANGIDAGTAKAYESEGAKRLLADAKDWRLILQIGRDERVGLSLPGAFYVLMREQDVKTQRFEKAWIVYEQD
jgi:hypothetical protein